jgi:2-oxoisovalerate dehydrogenase E1 component
MYLSRRLDDKEIQLKRQNRICFQSAAPATRRSWSRPDSSCGPDDWFFATTATGLMLETGMTPLDMLLGR